MGVSGATTLKVTDALLLSIEVTPVNDSVPPGRTQQFTATANTATLTVTDAEP
jgi:hypothetical protein